MKDKIKIKISYEAYDKLLNLLKASEDYSYVRFQYKDGCCGSSKVDIYLDNFKDGDISDRIDDLPILYDYRTLSNILEVTLVYRKFSFMVKTKTTMELFKNCSSCTKGCGSKGGCSHSCSNVKKMA